MPCGGCSPAAGAPRNCDSRRLSATVPCSPPWVRPAPTAKARLKPRSEPCRTYQVPKTPVSGTTCGARRPWRTWAGTLVAEMRHVELADNRFAIWSRMTRPTPVPGDDRLPRRHGAIERRPRRWVHGRRTSLDNAMRFGRFTETRLGPPRLRPVVGRRGLPCTAAPACGARTAPCSATPTRRRRPRFGGRDPALVGEGLTSRVQLDRSGRCSSRDEVEGTIRCCPQPDVETCQRQRHLQLRHPAGLWMQVVAAGRGERYWGTLSQMRGSGAARDFFLEGSSPPSASPFRSSQQRRG